MEKNSTSPGPLGLSRFIPIPIFYVLSPLSFKGDNFRLPCIFLSLFFVLPYDNIRFVFHSVIFNNTLNT